MSYAKLPIVSNSLTRIMRVCACYYAYLCVFASASGVSRPGPTPNLAHHASCGNFKMSPFGDIFSYLVALLPIDCTIKRRSTQLLQRMPCNHGCEIGRASCRERV